MSVATEIQSPNSLKGADGLKIFLGGSIEMGAAEDWQKTLIEELSKYPVTLLNPRRDDWNTAWEQSIKNKTFKQQVKWELDALDTSHVIVFYFDPNTKSPITLMELGLRAGISDVDRSNYQTIIVCCPEGFYRKGNVDIICKRYNIKSVETFPKLVKYLKAVCRDFT